MLIIEDTIWMQIFNRRNCVCEGGKKLHRKTVVSAQLFCNPKTALKQIKSI